MDFKTATETAALIGGLIGFGKWLFEYSKKQELERFKILQIYRDRFRLDPVISKVHNYMINMRGSKPKDSASFLYGGQFEEVWLLAKRGLMRKTDALNFFGWYAQNLQERLGADRLASWRVLNEFVAAYQASIRTHK